MSINIVLADGQDGYEAVSKYVIEYWENVCYATVLVTLETSSNGKNYRRTNEIVSPYEWKCEYLHDWWEGEPYIKVLGIKDIDGIDILPTADVVEVVRCKDCKFNVENMKKDPLDITDYSGDDIVCSYFMTDGMQPDDFCSRGERREE